MVLCAHAEDAALGCAGALAFHRQRGDALRLLVLCGGLPGASAPDPSPARDVRHAGYEPERLGAVHELVERLRAELEEFGPELVYAPRPEELLPDRRAASLALAAALRHGPPRRVVLYALDGRSSEGAPPGDGLAELSSETLLAHALARARAARPAVAAGPAVTAVISTWNKAVDVCANLDGLRAQTRPFDAVIVVDNASSDDTVARLTGEYPEVRLIVMPHSAYGACETFNIGFSSATTPLVAILDDDVVLPPEWLEKALERLEREPATTAIVSTEVVEPGMPPGYLDTPQLMRERYMSTFRGCASLARLEALRQAGYYDERLYIYGNERDLTCRLLARGWRVLQYPAVRAFHKTPFGIKMGKRSLYYHARNAWLTMIKYAPARDLARLPWLVLTRVLLRRSEQERGGAVSDATGTIGIGRSVRETPGAWWVLVRAAWSVLVNLPYCLRRREPVRAPDFELPLS